LFKKYLTSIKQKVQDGFWIKNAFGKYGEDDEGDNLTHLCLVGHVNVLCGTDYEESADAFDPIYDLEFPEKEFDDLERSVLLRKIWLAIKTYNPRTKARSIESWNDRRTTRPQDVLAVLDIALGED